MEDNVETLGLYKDIGKKTRDLLYKDFQSGLMLKIGTPFLDFGYVKVKLDLSDEYFGMSTCLGLTASARPIVQFSALAGTKELSLGADVTLNTASWDLDNCNFGLTSSSGNINVSLAMNNWGDTVKASFYHLLSPTTSTAAGVEIAHRVSSNERTVTIGAHHALNSGFSVKARVSSRRVGMVTKYPVGPHFVTIFSDADRKNMEAMPKMGLGLALRF